MHLTLRETLLHLFNRFGRYNALYYRGDERLNKLWEQHRNLNKVIRKKITDERVIRQHLALVFGWTAAYCDSFINLPIVEAMSEKYPIYGCAYCRSSPCACEFHVRKDITLYNVNNEQLRWSIADWQRHNLTVYGAANIEMGVHQAFNRLTEEITEALSAHRFDVQNPADIHLDEHRRLIALEFADVFQWLTALSNIIGVDLQLAVEEQYIFNTANTTTSA